MSTPEANKQTVVRRAQWVGQRTVNITATIPPGSFKKQTDGSFTFEGKIQGVGLGALIRRTGTLRYAFEAQARGANLTGTVNTVYPSRI